MSPLRILIIGGTRFTGRPLIQQLINNGHEVTLFHRGQTGHGVCAEATTILGDRKKLLNFREHFQRLKLDVAVDMIPYTKEDAASFMETMHGVAKRVVALSSIDVYLAYGRIHRTEPGPPVPVPLSENSPLRQTDQPEGPAYDKLAVEKIVMGVSDLPGAILRLPAIYGPHDHMHRLYPYLKRMDDKRPAILLNERMATWCFSRGYVENVSAAIALAIENERSAGEIYNVADSETLPEQEWIRAIGRVVGWKGDVISVSECDLPKHLQTNTNWEQDWKVDTSKIRSELGYHEPLGREEALRRTLEWERANPPITIDPQAFDYAGEDEALRRLELG